MSERLVGKDWHERCSSTASCSNRWNFVIISTMACSKQLCWFTFVYALLWVLLVDFVESVATDAISGVTCDKAKLLSITVAVLLDRSPKNLVMVVPCCRRGLRASLTTSQEEGVRLIQLWTSWVPVMFAVHTG